MVFTVRLEDQARPAANYFKEFNCNIYPRVCLIFSPKFMLKGNFHQKIMDSKINSENPRDSMVSFKVFEVLLRPSSSLAKFLLY